VGIGPQINASVAAKQEGLLHHEQVFNSFFRFTLACVKIGEICLPFLLGCATILIASDGKIFCETAAELAFGTRPTRCAAVSRRYMMTYRSA
jgi:hypothetical protein